MKKLILSSLLLASNQMAMAANWIPSQSSSTEHKETTHIDWDSIKGYYFNSYDKNNYYVNAWVKKNYPTAQKLTNGKLYREEKSFWYVDCLNQKMQISEAHFHTSTGKYVGSQSSYVYNYSSDNWIRIVPGSVGEMIAIDICQYYNFKLSNQTK